MLNKQKNDYTKLFPTDSALIAIQELLIQDDIEKSYYAAMREVLKEKPLLAYKQLLEDKVEEFKTPIYISSVRSEVENGLSELELNYYRQLTQDNFYSDGQILNRLFNLLSHEEVKGIRYKALRNAVMKIYECHDLTTDQQDEIHLDGDLIEECIQNSYIAYIQIEEEVC